MACWWNATVQPIHDDSDPSKVSFIFGVCFFANTSYIDELQRARKTFVPNQMTSVMLWAMFLFIPHAVAILCSLIERRLPWIWKKSPEVKPPVEQPSKKDNAHEDDLPLALCKPTDQACIDTADVIKICCDIVFKMMIDAARLGKMIDAALSPPQLPPPPPPPYEIVCGTPIGRCKHEVESTERTKKFTRWAVTVFCVVARHWLLRRGWRYSRANFHHKSKFDEKIF